jgi:hypothetical protein
MESLKIALEKYKFKLPEEDVLLSVTEYFLCESTSLDVSALNKAITASSVYSENSKLKTNKLLEFGLRLVDEEKLTSADRKAMSDSEFGLPKERKYPMNDESHVAAAIALFNKCTEDEKPELARNILWKSKKFKMEVNKDAEWYKYLNKPKTESYVGEFSKEFNFLPVVLEVYSKESIKELSKKFLVTVAASKEKPERIAKKFMITIYAKPLGDIIDDIPTILDVLRRVFLIGGAMLINPFLAIFVGLIDHLIHQIVNRDEAERLERQLDREIKKMEKKLEKEKDKEIERAYKEYLHDLDKQKTKVTQYKDSLISDKERTRIDSGEDDDFDMEFEMAFIYTLSEAVINDTENTRAILEVSNAKVLAHKGKDIGKAAAGKAGAIDRRLSKTLDQKVDDIKNKIMQAAKNDRREAVIKGQIIPSASKLLKFALATGAVWAINPVVAVVGALGAMALATNANSREQKMILDEISVELKIVAKEIETAERNDDVKALRELLRLQKKLELEQKRIKYKQATGSSL